MTQVLRIAFTGTHGSGKSTTAAYVAKLLKDNFGVEPTVFPSAPRAISQMTGYNTQAVENDEFQLYAGFLRRIWQLQSLAQDTPVLSERCMIDEVGYQKYRVDSLQKQITTGLSVPGVPGQMTDTQASFAIAQASLQVLLQQAVHEAINYWNHIYLFTPQDGPVESDGVRPEDKQYQKDIQTNIEWVVSVVNGLSLSKVPTDELEARLFFDNEVSKWTNYVSTDQSAPSGLILPV